MKYRIIALVAAVIFLGVSIYQLGYINGRIYEALH